LLPLWAASDSGGKPPHSTLTKEQAVIDIQCANCGVPLRIQDHQATKRMRCPTCRDWAVRMGLPPGPITQLLASAVANGSPATFVPAPSPPPVVAPPDDDDLDDDDLDDDEIDDAPVPAPVAIVRPFAASGAVWLSPMEGSILDKMNLATALLERISYRLGWVLAILAFPFVLGAISFVLWLLFLALAGISKPE
jgi:hypothetical protein